MPSDQREIAAKLRAGGREVTPERTDVRVIPAEHGALELVPSKRSDRDPALDRAAHGHVRQAIRQVLPDGVHHGARRGIGLADGSDEHRLLA
jgi:hypothetical protein